jgi:hypothetical protein
VGQDGHAMDIMVQSGAITGQLRGSFDASL